MLSTAAPGNAAWQTSPESIASVVNESINFFYINIGLANLGINPLPSIAEHPVSEALFNLVGAWGVMFLPIMLADSKSKQVRQTAVLIDQ